MGRPLRAAHRRFCTRGVAFLPGMVATRAAGVTTSGRMPAGLWTTGSGCPANGPLFASAVTSLGRPSDGSIHVPRAGAYRRRAGILPEAGSTAGCEVESLVASAIRHPRRLRHRSARSGRWIRRDACRRALLRLDVGTRPARSRVRPIECSGARHRFADRRAAHGGSIQSAARGETRTRASCGGVIM